MTKDRGESWVQEQSRTGAHLYSVNFVDANHGWAAGSNDTILVTGDGGATWRPQMNLLKL